MKINMYKKFKHNKCTATKSSVKIELIKYVSYISVILFALLVMMDYFVITQTFNFSAAAFLNIYLFNLNIFGSQFFIFFALLPMGVALSLFIIPYFISLLSREYEDSLKKFNNSILLSESRLSLFIVFSVIEMLLLSWASMEFLIWVGDKIDNIIFFSILYLVCLVIIILLPIVIVLVFKIYTFNKLLVVIYMILVLSIGVWLFKRPFDTNILKFYQVHSLLVVSQFLLLLMFTLDNTKKKEQKVSLKYIYTIVMLFVIFMIGIEYKTNEDSWKDTMSKKLTFNLLVNKKFLSINNETINIDVLNYNDSSPCKDVDTIEVSIDNNTTDVLAISKSIRLYFKKDDNNTCIYAVEKQYYKGRPVYNLLDIGYMDNNSTK